MILSDFSSQITDCSQRPPKKPGVSSLHKCFRFNLSLHLAWFHFTLQGMEETNASCFARVYTDGEPKHLKLRWKTRHERLTGGTVSTKRRPTMQFLCFPGRLQLLSSATNRRNVTLAMFTPKGPRVLLHGVQDQAENVLVIRLWYVSGGEAGRRWVRQVEGGRRNEGM